MSNAIRYRIRQADSTDLAACLDWWARKVSALFAGVVPQPALDQGRRTISGWIEAGVMQLVVGDNDEVLTCLSPSGDATGLCTPGELTLAEIGPHSGDRFVHPEHRSDRLGPLARALREVAATRDELAQAHSFSAVDDTFVVEADVLQRRLRELEARLTTMQAALDPDE